MTSITPPWYGQLAKLLESYDTDSNTKKEIVEYANRGMFGHLESGKKEKFSTIIKEVVDKDLLEKYKRSLGIMGKIKEGKELNQEELITFANFHESMFLWNVMADRFYKNLF